MEPQSDFSRAASMALERIHLASETCEHRVETRSSPGHWGNKNPSRGQVGRAVFLASVQMQLAPEAEP